MVRFSKQDPSQVAAPVAALFSWQRSYFPAQSKCTSWGWGGGAGSRALPGLTENKCKVGSLRIYPAQVLHGILLKAKHRPKMTAPTYS